MDPSEIEFSAIKYESLIQLLSILKDERFSRHDQELDEIM